MNRSQRAAIIVTIILLAAIGWRLHRSDDTPAPVTQAPVPVAPTAPRRADQSPVPTTTPVPQRLAGVALGNVRYAVVEQPDGTTALYRAGDQVPGLGRIVDVTEDSATFAGPNGEVRLRVTAPPSPTLAPAVTEAAAEEPVEPTRSSGRARSATESQPSSARDLPAS